MCDTLTLNRPPRRGRTLVKLTRLRAPAARLLTGKEHFSMPELVVVPVVEAADNQPRPEARTSRHVEVLANDDLDRWIRKVADLLARGESGRGRSRGIQLDWSGRGPGGGRDGKRGVEVWDGERTQARKLHQHWPCREHKKQTLVAIKRGGDSLILALQYSS